MKNSTYIIIAFLVGTLSLVGCKKEEYNDYVIQNITYDFTGLNDCEFSEGGANGSSLTLHLSVDNPDYTNIYGLKVIFKQKKKKDDVQILSRELSLWFEDDEINTYRCIRFGSLSSGTYVVSIMTMDGLESEPFTVNVARPSGAN